jgi:hypothetical protein
MSCERYHWAKGSQAGVDGSDSWFNGVGLEVCQSGCMTTDNKGQGGTGKGGCDVQEKSSEIHE